MMLQMLGVFAEFGELVAKVCEEVNKILAAEGTGD